ncbi:MAG: PEP-CTERM sorting domain-containing protein [Pirellulales bacterium]
MARREIGAPAGTLPNDTAGVVIGAGQFNLWKSHFGSISSGSVLNGAGAMVSAVPEPATGLSLLAGATAGLVLWRRCRFRAR